MSDTKRKPDEEEAPENHDDDDDDDDDEKPGKSSALAQELAVSRGFFPDFFIKAKSVVFRPVQFFQMIPTTDGLIQPTIFLVVAATIFSILQAISNLNLWVFFKCFFTSLLHVAVASTIIAFALKKMGGKGSFENTFKVIAYSKVTLLFAWLALGPIPIGGIVALPYGVWLNILGLEEIHQLPRKLIVTLTVTLAVIGFLIHWRFGI